LSQMYSSFSRRLCTALLSRGDAPTALRLLMKLTAYNELDEETIKLLMKALALQKNKEALVRQYLQFMEMLHEEMGISPSYEVNELYKQLLSDLDSEKLRMKQISSLRADRNSSI
ncbi:bacterial transcriptional activator domain-containing protein, partial [Paenibacillus sepulcri]|nr:bacterial transcriptional activator domain-containing protein [Paenibacillus sepulcri]